MYCELVNINNDLIEIYLFKIYLPFMVCRRHNVQHIKRGDMGAIKGQILIIILTYNNCQD